MTEELQSVNLEELTLRMDELKDLQARLKFDLKNTESEIKKIELQLANVLSKMGVDNMEFGIYSFGYEIKVAKRFNQKAFGQMYPELLEKFKIETESKTFEFKINK